MTETGICDSTTENLISSAKGCCIDQANVSLTVVHNRKRFPLNLPSQSTVRLLKQQLETLTNVPIDMQKLIFHGILDDESTLLGLNLPSRDAKIMLIGSGRDATDQVVKVDQTSNSSNETVVLPSGESSPDWSSEPEHRRVLDKFGRPEDTVVGIINSQDILGPDEALTGLYDKRGQALRLRFKSETSELWLATNSVTHKIPLSTIHVVESQAIIEQPEYHIMAFQLGPTQKSRFFVYWVPAQYVESIRTMVAQYRLFSRQQ